MDEPDCRTKHIQREQKSTKSTTKSTHHATTIKQTTEHTNKTETHMTRNNREVQD